MYGIAFWKKWPKNNPMDFVCGYVKKKRRDVVFEYKYVEEENYSYNG